MESELLTDIVALFSNNNEDYKMLSLWIIRDQDLPVVPFVLKNCSEDAIEILFNNTKQAFKCVIIDESVTKDEANRIKTLAKEQNVPICQRSELERRLV